MQEIKTLMLRLGTTPNIEEYVFDGPMADAHIQGYLNQRFKLHSTHPGAIDQSTSAISVLYVLIRETDENVAEAQTVESMEEQLEQAKWAETVPA